MSNEALKQVLQGYELELQTFSDVLSGLNSLNYSSVSSEDKNRLKWKLNVLKSELNKVVELLSK